MNAAIGIFGGTFDPIHFGHLRMAEELAESLALAEVRFIPAGQPPHRATPQTDAVHRLHMARLAIAGNARFVLDDREVRESRPSYTVDTLAALRRELGGTRPLWLLMGADAFIGLTTWKDWRHLFDLAHLAVAHRPGYALRDSDALDPALRQELDKRLAGPPATDSTPETDALPAGRIVLKAMTPLDIAATDLRTRLHERRSVRYLLPDAVLSYIQQHHLYA